MSDQHHDVPSVETSPYRSEGFAALEGLAKSLVVVRFHRAGQAGTIQFIAILIAIGAVITQWDTLLAYYDKWTHPTSSEAAVKGDVEWFCPMHPSVVFAITPRINARFASCPFPNGRRETCRGSPPRRCR